MLWAGITLNSKVLLSQGISALSENFVKDVEYFDDNYCQKPETELNVNLNWVLQYMPSDYVLLLSPTCEYK